MIRFITVFFFGLALVSAEVARAGTRQDPLAFEVTLSLKDVTLREALRQIEMSAQVKFVFSSSKLQLEERVSLIAVQQRLGEVLQMLLAPLRIRFTVHPTNNFVVLTSARSDGQSIAPQVLPRQSAVPLPALLTVSGRVVTKATGEPMAGVNVVVKGTTNGTSTDASGLYRIEAGENDVLVYSFIGYKSIEVAVASRATLDVSLEEDVAALNEVVVNAGYWEVKQREQTGNISRVTAEEIAKQPVNNPLEALIGRMPGVNIQQSSGLPGTSFRISIRGRNSLRAEGNDPLYIVDGVPFTSNPMVSQGIGGNVIPASSPFNYLNPSDIQSIEVLKDADATAIYGSRGANGVVLVTTKKGRPGAEKLDINHYEGAGRVATWRELLNTEQYLEMRREAFTNDGVAPGATDHDLNGSWDQSRYTDWQQELIGGTARMSSTQLSYSGGNENTQFMLSAGHLKQTSVFPGNFSDRKLSTHLNINHLSANKRFQLSFSTSYVVNTNNLPSGDLAQFIFLPPNAPALYDESGNLNWQNGTWTNPLGRNYQPYKGRATNLVNNTTLSYELAKGLKFKTSLGYTNVRMEEQRLAMIKSQNPATSPTGASVFANNINETWLAEPQLEYHLRTGSGTLTSLVGGTLQESVTRTQTMSGIGYTSDLLLENLTAAPTRLSSSTYTAYRYASAFARINYAHGDRYFVNLTARRDGSSRFGTGNKFANFGAVGAAWIFSSEQFFEGLTDIISFGKLRSSYGTTGSDRIGDFGYLDTYSATLPYQGGTGLMPTQLSNADFAWETNRKFESAIDLNFFSNRLQTTVSWYRNRSSNQLVGFGLPDITGFTSVIANTPAEVENTGTEIDVVWSAIAGNSFQWTIGMNATVPQNKLIAFPGLERTSYASVYAVGSSLHTQKLYHLIGVDPQTGIYQFEDLNGNGLTNDSPGDRATSKPITSKYFGGVRNSFVWGPVSLDIFIQVVNQLRANPHNDNNIPGAMSNQPVAVLERWRQPGDDAAYQRFSQAFGPYRTAHNQVRVADNLVDASFARLKNISLSWQVPANRVSRYGVTAIRVYGQAQNVFTITSYDGDPEILTSTVVPNLRMFTLGLQITF